jgi:hypothetical protein
MDGSYSYLPARVGGASGPCSVRLRIRSTTERRALFLERWSLEGFWSGTGDQLIGGEDDEEGAAKATPAFEVELPRGSWSPASAMSSHWRP